MISQTLNRRAGIQPFGTRRKSSLTAAAALSLHHHRTLPCAAPAAAERRQLQLLIISPQRQLQQLEQQQQRQLVCSRASSSSGSSSSPQQPQGGGFLSFFDRLPPRVQLGVMGALLFVGMFVIPFLQPTFIYGDTSKQAAQQQTITNVKEGSAASEPQLYKLPRYIPVASELYDFLQENSMPKKLPDGRTESPGVLRIYLSSLTILALFYACSTVVGLILRSVATILRAVGIAGPPKPQE